MKDLINGAAGFRDFADFVILSDKNPFDTNILKKNGVIFCKTDFLPFLFKNIQFSARKYVLITHWSDYHIDQSKFLSKPKCIVKWYASAAAYKHHDLIPIPVGFGIHFLDWPNYNKELEKWYIDNVNRLRSVKKDTLTVYCNYTIDNLRPPRHDVMSAMQANNAICYTPKSKNDVLKEYDYMKLPYKEYCEDMARFKFVACPPGNGIDSHRIWEALYMGCIPIVIKNLINEHLDLPILRVNKYSEVTSKLLFDYLEFYKTHDFNYDQAQLSYWINKILENLKNS